MGIVDRVQDAELLWEAGRREGALMSALIAFAATARRVRPEPIKDRDAFEGLFRDAIELDLEVEFRSKSWPVEAILYCDDSGATPGPGLTRCFTGVVPCT